MLVVVLFRICAVFIINQMVFSEATVIYCNDKKHTWRDAMLGCIDAGGSPVGKDMFGNGMQTDDQLYWTSDFYTRQSVYTAEQADFCGYRNYNNTSRFGTENFRNCSHVLFYVCCTEGQTLGPDCLRTGTWTESTTCNQTFNTFGSADFPSGDYWTRTAIELIQHNIPVNRPSYYHIQDFYQCGAINSGGTFQYTRNCDQALSSYCSFVNRISVLPAHMIVCNVPPSLLDNTSTKVQTSHLTTILTPALPLRTLQTETTQRQSSWKTTSQRQASRKTTTQRQSSWKTTSQRTASTNLNSESFLTTFEQTNLHMKSTKDPNPSPTASSVSTSNIFSKSNAISHWQVLTTRGQIFLTQIPNVYGRLSTATHEIRQQDTRQNKVEQTRSGWIIGVAVGVGIAVALTIVVIGLVFMRRRGIICQPSSKETGAHVNATYGVANGDVSFTLPVVSTFENVQAHPDNGDVNSQFHGNDNHHHIYARTNMAFPDNSCQNENYRNNAVENALYGIQAENNGKSMDYQDVKHRRQNESGRTNNMYSRVNKPIPFNKNKDSKATQCNEKTRLQILHDNQRVAKGTPTTAYDNVCFKDSTKLVQRNDYANLQEETDGYDTTCSGNIHLHYDMDYNTLERNDDYTVANICGNKTPKIAINVADDCTYNTLSNRKDDYNAVNLHRDNVLHETFPLDETYNTFSDETDDYNVVDFKGESTPQVTIHQDDTYNTLGRRMEEYNTVNFHNNTEADETDDCYDHLH